MKKKINRIGKIFGVLSVLLSWAFCFCYAQGLEPFEKKKEKENFVYDSQEKSDPFIALFDKQGLKKMSEQVKEEELLNRIGRITVNGILWDEQNPLVMINGKIHKLGDYVEDLKIEDIDDNSVLFNYDGLVHKISIIKKLEADGQGGTNE